MTPEHTPTDNETAMYEAMSSGQWDLVWALQEEPNFWEDFNNANMHYQRDHEAPAEERVQATAEMVAVENAEAQEEITTTEV